jgi:hypothetical protein
MEISTLRRKNDLDPVFSADLIGKLGQRQHAATVQVGFWTNFKERGAEFQSLVHRQDPLISDLMLYGSHHFVWRAGFCVDT